MFVALTILSILVAIALTFIVIIQNSKGGGLSSTFGASNASQVLGARRSGDLVETMTWYLAGGLAIMCFLAAVAGKPDTAPSGLFQDRSAEAAFTPGNTSATEMPATAPADDANSGAIQPSESEDGN